MLTVENCFGRVAELVDALASGASGRKAMRVQVPPRPPHFAKASCGLQPTIAKSDGWLTAIKKVLRSVVPVALCEGYRTYVLRLFA